MNNFTKGIVLATVIAIAGCAADADNGIAHKIKWDISAGADGYTLYCGVATGAYTTNTLIGGGATSEILLAAVNLANDNSMNYCALTAYNFAGESAFSNEIAFAATGGDLVSTKPAPPGGLNIE